MNEIKQVIILAAGRSRRMENLSNKIPKCLFEYDNEKIICRLVRQIKKYGVEKIVITVGYRADLMKKIFADDPNVILVNNTMYEEDVNINSMNLALKHIDGPCVVFEADTIMEDSLVKYVLGSDFEGKSVWFTKGKFVEPQYGGILKSDKYGKVTDIRIIPTYQAKYKGYSKLSGLMRINKEQIELFKQLVIKYAKSTIKQYYLVPWIENLDKLPCYEGDISHFEFFTFNKPEEYYQALNKKIGQIEKNVKYELVDISLLKPIEDYDKTRATSLEKEILNKGFWTVPLIVEKKDYMILDGHHRFATAKKLGLKKIPAILVDYDDVDVWTLRKEYPVSQKLVRKKVVTDKKIYPYKTVKHKYYFEIPTIENLTLGELK